MKIALKLVPAVDGLSATNKRTTDAGIDSLASKAGVFLYGEDATSWIETVCSWGIASGDVRFLPLTSLSIRQAPPLTPSQRIIGVLVVSDAISERAAAIRQSWEEAAVGRSAGCGNLTTFPPQFYRQVAERMYAPVDAALSPQVLEAELLDLLPADAQSMLVWHPSAGLMQFESHQILSLSDFLASPPITPCERNLARYGEVLNDFIRGLHAETSSENLSDILGGGQDDIGTQADQLSDAPRAPDEVGLTGLRDAMSSIQRMTARIVLGVTNNIPAREGGSRTLTRLHEWAAGLLNSGMSPMREGRSGNTGRNPPTPHLTSQRENELKRLLNLLQNDPDAGLRYALPLYGSGSRGLAPPSGRLGQRNTQFSLNQLGGGGRADVWDIPWQYQLQLRQRYQELAQREMRLGNYRRAAYIYGTLLHDLNSAASALETGRCFQEAATIYKSHLKLPLKAAECLRAGGFWDESVAIFCEHNRWMDAGELYLQMGEPDLAKTMFSHEVTRRVSSGHYRSAAELAESHLNDPERAIEILEQGWQYDTARQDCLRDLMSLMGSRGWHRRAMDSLARIQQDCDQTVSHRADAVLVCGECATTYPDASTRDYARKATWLLASQILSSPFSHQNYAALNAVRRLASEDELLHRDASRFSMILRKRDSDRTEHVHKSVRRSTRASYVAEIRPAGGVLMPVEHGGKRTTWLQMAQLEQHIFCLGRSVHNHVMVSRSPYPVDNKFMVFKGPEWTLNDPAVAPQACQLVLDPSDSQRIYLQQFPGRTPWNFAVRKQTDNRDSIVKVLPPQIGTILSMTFDKSGCGWILIATEDGALHLESTGDNGRVRRTFIVHGIEAPSIRDVDETLSREQGESFCCSICPFDGLLAIVYGDVLYTIEPPAFESMDAGGTGSLEARRILRIEPVGCVAVSPRETTPRLAMSQQTGAVVAWPVTGDSCRIAQDLCEPLLACTTNGIFIAVCPETGRIEAYRCNKGRAELVAEREEGLQLGSLAAVCSGRQPGDFLLLKDNGKLHRFRIPAR
ncbi:MAG: hypothetical protein R3C20_01895 [Planctomycetaceae bacterium]